MSLTPTPPDADEFAELADGQCHYRFDGPPDGPVLLLIHGATVPAWEFDRLVPFLNQAGFRTLRADLFGHGYSDRPRRVYDHDLFVRQLIELLDHVGQRDPVHILGHSLGAAIGARLVAAAPQRCVSLLLAAPLVDFVANKPYTRALKIPLLGECLVPIWVVPMLVRRRSRRYRLIEDGRFAAKFKRQVAIPGFGRALLSMFRSGALEDQGATYRALADHPHPVAVLRGQHDTIVTDAQVRRVRGWLPQAVFHEVADTEHAFLLSHPELVAPPLLAFLKDAAVRSS